MILDHFAYLITVIIFAGGAVFIEWILAFKDLKKHLKVIILTAGIAIVATFIAEPLALSWGCWAYNPHRLLNIFIGGAALETYVFAVLVSIAVASATLIWSGYEEKSFPLIKITLKKLKEKLKNK